MPTKSLQHEPRCTEKTNILPPFSPVTDHRSNGTNHVTCCKCGLRETKIDAPIVTPATTTKLFARARACGQAGRHAGSTLGVCHDTNGRIPLGAARDQRPPYARTSLILQKTERYRLHPIFSPFIKKEENTRLHTQDTTPVMIRPKT